MHSPRPVLVYAATSGAASPVLNPPALPYQQFLALRDNSRMASNGMIGAFCNSWHYSERFAFWRAYQIGGNTIHPSRRTSSGT